MARAYTHEWVWIVDPLDGTSQFKKGTPIFATVVALLHHGETQFGAIYQPIKGHMASAIKGQGVVYTDANGQDMCGLGRFSASDLPFGDVTSIFAYHGRTPDSQKKFLQPLKDGHPNHIVHLHAHEDYLSFLRGDIGFLRFSEGPGKCPPWDHAAGVLMAQEFGGIVRVDRSGVLSPYDPSRRHDRMAIASSAQILQCGLAYTSHVEESVLRAERTVNADVQIKGSLKPSL